VTLHSVRGTLNPTPPFDFARSLDFLGGFGPLAGEQALSARSIDKAVMLHGRSIVFRLSSTGDGEAPRLEYTLFSEQPLDSAIRRAAADRVAFFLVRDHDQRPVKELARADAAFAPVVEQLYGYHQVKFPTPFEAASWAILTQRNTMAIGRNLKRAITARFGSALEVDGTRHEMFPEAETLASADPEELLALLPNLRRAEYLSAVARAFSGADEAWLRAAPYGEVDAWLRAITGIGAWSASFVLLRGLGRTERVPVGEARIVEAASRRYNAGAPLSQAEIERIAERYGIWQGYWAHYLRVAS
jgi:DNA-3-methyladenine glycosylase II